MNKTRSHVIPAQKGVLVLGTPYLQVPSDSHRDAGITMIKIEVVAIKLRMTILILLLLSLQSISFAQGYKIETTVHNTTDTVAYIGHHFATQRYLDDTAKVVNGKAVFKGNKTLTEGIYFYYTPTTYFEFLIGEQRFSMETTAPDFINLMKIEHSKTNEGFYKMQQFTSAMKAKNKLFTQAYDSAFNDVEKAKIKAQLQELNTEVKNLPNSVKRRLCRYIFSKNYCTDAIA